MCWIQVQVCVERELREMPHLAERGEPEAEGASD
jgi:hypothetical protein